MPIVPVESPTYQSWRSMKRRCSEPKNKDWAIYGGRGIKVCSRWLCSDGLANFIADMGLRPEGKTLDRIDSNEDYRPDNCKWSTASEQMANRRDTIKTEWRGQLLSTREIATASGLERPTIVKRYKQGDRGEYLTRPIRHCTRKGFKNQSSTQPTCK